MMRPLLCCLLLAPTFAAAQQVSCPLTLPENSIKVEQAPDGWLATSNLARLSSAGMLSGHPSRIGYLVPNSTKKAKGSAVDTWAFQPGEEKWLWCGYGSEVIQLAKRMDDKATHCTITGKEDRHGWIVEITVVCK